MTNQYLSYPKAIDKILKDMELIFKTEKKQIGLLLHAKDPEFKDWAIPVLSQLLLKESQLIKQNKPDLQGEIPHALHQMLLLEDKNAKSILADFKSEMEDK